MKALNLLALNQVHYFGQHLKLRSHEITLVHIYCQFIFYLL